MPLHKLHCEVQSYDAANHNPGNGTGFSDGDNQIFEHAMEEEPKQNKGAGPGDTDQVEPKLRTRHTREARHWRHQLQTRYEFSHHHRRGAQFSKQILGISHAVIWFDKDAQ